MRLRSLLLVLLLTSPAFADRAPLAKPADPFFAKFEPIEAPKPTSLLLRKGDRLAICGDSITEQKMYSRLIETYLTVCVPELEITARQYGWSGERASGFLNRMQDDCLRFSPTIATTCYGMNDHEYKPYEDRIGNTYRTKQTAIVEKFKSAGVRVVLGTAGCVGKMPTWVKTATGTVEDLNVNLSKLRNIDIEIADEQMVAFADVFWPMFTTGFTARQKYGSDYCIEGKDGVHPGWAGQTIMAYAFLKGLGVNGDIGTFTVDLAGNQASVSSGHELVSFKDGEMQVKSIKYPFCATGGELSKDDNIRSGMQFVPFSEDLNRLKLIVKNGPAKSYKVTWGDQSRSYTADELGQGVNLANDFSVNPFSEQFKKVDSAVGAKQAYETKQIKDIFHGLFNPALTAEAIVDPELKDLFALRTTEGKLDRESIVKATEEKRAPLATAIKTAFVPVTHTIKIVAE